MTDTRLLALAALAPLLNACGGGGGSSNTAPLATDIGISAIAGAAAYPGDTLQASYVYNDSEGDPEGRSRVRWLRDGDVIKNANSTRYELTHADVGHTLNAEVTPRATAGEVTGQPALSADLTLDLLAGERLTLEPITSTYTGRTYPVFVRLPPGYGERTRTYPLLYGLDGERLFELSARLLDEKNYQAILVSIASLSQEQRLVDFSIRGAENYLKFVTLELLPYVEAQVRADTARRALTGHSHSGLFTTLALLLEEPADRHFGAYVVQDGAFWDGPDETVALEEALFDKDPELPVTLIVAGATDGNLWGAQSINRAFSRPEYTQLESYLWIYNTNHSGVVEPSLRDALQILFP